MTITTTALEAVVLKAFNVYADDPEGTKGDLGCSWTGATELAEATGLAIDSVKGVLGSLVKKNLVYADPATKFAPAAVCLTEDGVDVIFSFPVGFDPANPVDAENWEAAGAAADAMEVMDSLTPEASSFIAALIKAGADEEFAKSMGTPFPGIICSTLRSYAGTWSGSRKTFISTVQLAGFNKYTAATQWQRARGK